ncbi:NUDIX domain-containing protein [Georgenia sp. 311]|uniref:NUDIX domain-containing protein n=1 Tax=Georgenia wutianyii TaxID=2585135 RepID=A0ABX5VRB9_9MICO|nr:MULTISPECIES: NUDIX hydrolase [Georgenia]QDB80391.1 NUDIX domain-containing protein [Georgenia wutianyii]TNC16911.1 NUDIX domain-containing protein [Georgenia sp. 311]
MTRTVLAAGTIVWRLDERNRLEVLLVHRPRYDDWSWPKGKLEEGESLAACAVRETAEETGVAVVLGQPLPKISYKLAGDARKEVHFWAARPAPEGDLSVRARPHVPPASTEEIDESRWVGVKDAAKLLTHARDHEPLGALIDQWKDERLDTYALLITRHARARKRTAWKGGESTRPLTSVGEAQARGLVPLFSAYGVDRVLSSPWRRCVDTVAPYAAAIGVEIEMHPEITEDAHKAKPKKARQLIREESRQRAPGVAICTHRPVLPTMMDEVAVNTPYRIMKQVPEADPWLKTSEMLVVHVGRRPGRAAVVVALEKHRAPSHTEALAAT